MRKAIDLSLNDLFEISAKRLENFFGPYLDNIPSLELKTAMEYCLLHDSKRFHPLLIYATGYIFNAPWENLDLPAASVELIHTYAQIQEDLPCMHNVEFRHGKSTCHKAFDEGIAVLTADALHTLATEIILSHPAPLPIPKRLLQANILNTATGPFGLVAGQALENSIIREEFISNDLLLEIYKLKTVSLFTACMELGWSCSDDDDEINEKALKEFGNCLGLAFQIQTDIVAMLKNENLYKKTTYPKLHGLEQAKNKVQSLYQSTLEAINYLGQDGQLLRELASYMLEGKED